MNNLTAQQVALLSAIKQAPASILLALWMNGEPMGSNDLVTTTGWSKNQVTAGLKKLAALDLVQQHNRYSGWQLTGKVRQLTFGSPSTDDSRATTTTALNRKRQYEQAGMAAEVALTRVGSPSTDDSRALPEIDTHTLDNLNALRQYGVGKNQTTTTLAADENITPQYIHAHASRLRAEQRLSPALLITVLQCDDPLPEAQSDEPSRRQKYAEWNRK